MVRICVREVSLILVSFSHECIYICDSAYENGCMVDDLCAMAAD